jgi:hypothetical protein
MIAGTKAESVIAIIEQIQKNEIRLPNTLDMAANMGIAKKCFLMPLVTDRFHVQKLALKLYKKSE